MQNEKPGWTKIKLLFKWILILLSGIIVHLLCYSPYIFRYIGLPDELETLISTLMVNWMLWLILTYLPFILSIFSPIALVECLPYFLVVIIWPLIWLYGPLKLDQRFRTIPHPKSALLYVGSFPIAFIPLIIVLVFFPSFSTTMVTPIPFISITDFLLGYWLLFLWLTSWCGLWYLKLPLTLFQDRKCPKRLLLWMFWLIILTLVSYIRPLFPPPPP